MALSQNNIITIDQLNEQVVLTKADWVAVLNNTTKRTGKASFASLTSLLKGDFYTKNEILDLLKKQPVGVTQQYVDAGNAALQAAIDVEKQRMDTLVDNAPQALDTLAEIAAQLAADEAGAAAILATQQQHTQQFANVVHRTGDETIGDTKTFTSTINAFGGGVRMVGFNAADVTYSVIGITSYNSYLTIYSENAGIAIKSRDGDISIGTGNNAYTIFKNNGDVGIGTNSPSEKLDVSGNVKAAKFYGDGSLLTGLPYCFYGNPGNLNITQGSLGTNTFTGTFTRNRFGNNIYSNTIANNFYHNTIEDNFIGNTIGQNFQENHIGNYFTYNTIGDNVSFCTFHSYTTRNYIGANCSYLTFSNLCNYNNIGTNCSHIELYNCTGLTIPAGTTNAVFKNNVQIYPVAVSGSSVTVEQDLSSNSTTSVPSIKAVADAIANAGDSNASVSIIRFPTFTVTNDGAQAITLPSDANEALNVMVLEDEGFVRTIWIEDYSVTNNILTIDADANLKAGDKVSGNYFTKSTTISGSGSVLGSGMFPFVLSSSNQQ